MTDTQTPSPEGLPSQPKTPIDPAFIEDIKGFLKGDKKPKSPQSGAVLDSLKTAVAEQEDLVAQMGKLETAVRDGQGKGQQLLGKIDALVTVLHGLETSSEGTLKP